MTNGQYGSETPYAAMVHTALTPTITRMPDLVGVLQDDGRVHIWKDRRGEQHVTVPVAAWVELVEARGQGRWAYSQIVLVYGDKALIPHTLEYCVALHGR